MQVDESIKAYRIKAGMKHSVQNTGENEFYMVSFLVERKAEVPETPKMQAEKHFPEIIGTNLQDVLETYKWGEWYPITDNGITVTGFWNGDKGTPNPEIYELDGRGVYVKRSVV